MPTEKLIDIEKVIGEKNPKLKKILPRFVLNYIKRIVCEDRFNSLVTDLADYSGIEFVKKIVERYNLKIETIGAENIEKDTKYIFASNHPIGGFDGVIFMNEVDKYAGSLRFIVNDVLLNIKNYDPLFVGVNKHGSTARENIKLINDTYASEHQILIFPSGLVSRRKKGIVEDLKWHKSFITKAIQHKRDVIPVRISGELSSFFYNLANIRTSLKMKANLEMFYLADEAFKHEDTTIKIQFGKPIAYTSFDKTKTLDKWAQFVKSKVYELKF